jgi:lipopolysaccharide transport system permease protein
MKKTIIYEPNQRIKIGIFKSWIFMLHNITEYRQLIFQLFRRDFLNMYKKSFLGMGWLIITPIMGIVAWVFMNSTGVLSPGNVGIPYPAYVLLGTTLWGLFMNFYTGATQTLSSASSFILQVKFPHDVLLIKESMQQLANFFITFIITLIVVIGFGVIPKWQIVFLPAMILPLFFLGTAIGMVVSVLSVITVDMQKGVGIVMSLMMYATPVVYSSSIGNPLLQRIITVNPMSYLVGEIRHVIVYGNIEHPVKYLVSCAVAFLCFVVSWRFFYISEDKVIEKMI